MTGGDVELSSTVVSLGPILLLIGRVLFGGMFLFNGINHFTGRAAMVGYAQFKGVPMASLAIPLSGLWLLVSGALILTGYHAGTGLAMAALFLAVVTPKMHDFWKATDPNARMGDFINFQKNLALLGAALMLLSLARPWPYSL
jgi:putative oxidoreductase